MRKILFVAVLLLCATPMFGQCETFTILTESVPMIFVGQHYSTQIEAIGGTAPYTFEVFDAGNFPLPDGLRLKSDGSLKGKVSEPGFPTIFVRATDAQGCTQVHAYGLQIEQP
ncbi:MAG TPA: putative Ig domain-containing protein [Thermoanaerobaculia bacterium]|nr:putative Ig domain-containing protein [Thermoanaerobaculia bacterium]